MDITNLALDTVPNTGRSLITEAKTTLSDYYREFLAADFKEARVRKQNYLLRDSKSNRIAVRIRQFTQFCSLPSQYRARLPFTRTNPIMLDTQA